MNNYDLEDTNVDLSQSYIESLRENEKVKKYVKKKKTVDEEDQFVLQLLTKYVGPNFDKIFKRKFSFPGFLLGFFYMLYRKIYLLGFLYLFLTVLVATLFIKNPIVLLALSVETFIVNLIIGVQINRRYIDFAFNKVKKIEEKHNNLPDEAIINLCERKGGVSTLTAALLVILALVISISIYALLHNPIPGNRNTFNGKYNYDNSANLENELSFETYDVFELNTKSTKGHYIYYTNGCELELGKLKGYNSKEKLLKEMTKKYGTNYTTETIVNNSWNIINKDDTTYYLLGDKDKNIYLVIFSITDLNYKDSCLNYYNFIKSSLSIN